MGVREQDAEEDIWSSPANTTFLSQLGKKLHRAWYFSAFTVKFKRKGRKRRTKDRVLSLRSNLGSCGYRPVNKVFIILRRYEFSVKIPILDCTMRTVG